MVGAAGVVAGVRAACGMTIGGGFAVAMLAMALLMLAMAIDASEKVWERLVVGVSCGLVLAIIGGIGFFALEAWSRP